MIKIYLYCLLIAIYFFQFSVAQDAGTVMVKSIQAVQEINTCSYLIMSKAKITGMRDTNYQAGKCRYIRIDNDSLIGKHIFLENFSGVTEVYNGSVYFKARTTDSSVYIWDAMKFNFFKHQLTTNPIAYAPLHQNTNIYTKMLNDLDAVITLSADTIINEMICYHIKSYLVKKNEPGKNTVTKSTDLFIRKADFIPVGHIQHLISVANPVINNFESVFLEQLEINKTIDEGFFTLAILPSGYSFKQQAVINIKNYIVADEQIPDFDFSLLQSDVSFRNINNKNVVICIIDSGNCLPCLNAVQLLEHIYQLYNEKNLSVLLIVRHKITYPEDYEFIKNQEIIFPSLLKGEKLIEHTGTNVFPAMYIFNLKGEQIYKNEGYSRYLSSEMENVLNSLPLK